MRVKAGKQVSLMLLEPEPRRSPASLPQTTRAQLPPLGLRLSRVDWTEVMRKHGEHTSSVDFDSAPNSFYCEKAVEEATTALGQLYYKEPDLSPKPVRKRRKMRPVSLTASYEEQPDSAVRVSGKVTEAVDELELRVIQIRQSGGGLEAQEEEYKALEEGKDRVLERVSGCKLETVEAMKRLLGHYSRLLSSALSSYKQTSEAFKLQRERFDPPHVLANVPPPAYQFDLVDQRERHIQAKQKLEALERYIDADSEAYEKLKAGVLSLLETTSSGTTEYLQKLYKEMSKMRTLPDNLPLQYPNLSLSDWESELKHRFREVQRLTAKKVLSFFERKASVSHISLQTEFEYVDLEKYSQIRQKVALSEANIKELMLKVRDLEGEVELKQRVTLRLHSEFENERNAKETFAKDNARLKEEFEFLLKAHNSKQKELEEVTKELKDKRQIVKSLRREAEELKSKLDQKQYVIEWFETNHNSGFEQVKEVRKELRVLYKQYFQPKLLSSVLPGVEKRRRSIGQSQNFTGFQVEKQRKRAKSLIFSKRSEVETLGLDSTEALHPQKSKDSKGSKAMLKRRKVELGSRGNEEDEGEEEKDAVAEGEYEDSQAEDSEEDQLGPQIKRKNRKNRAIKAASNHKEPIEAGEELASEGETVIEQPHRKAKKATKPTKGKSKPADLPHSGIQPQDSVDTEAHRSPALSQASAEAESDEEGEHYQAERHRKVPPHAEDNEHHQVERRRKVPQHVEDKSAGQIGKEKGKAKRSTHGSKANPGPALPPASQMRSSRASGPSSPISTPEAPRVVYIPGSYSSFDLDANDKVCMTEADLIWPTIHLNSISTQYDYLRPEVVYEEEEDNAVIGADGVKYYMWPLNPNQLYGLSGDVFYHTVMRAFQAVPKVPLSKTGEPHQPSYMLDDSVSGSKVTGEMRLHPTKPRQVEHTATCGKDCKHLKTRLKPGKKEPLLPLARQDIRYGP